MGVLILEFIDLSRLFLVIILVFLIWVFIGCDRRAAFGQTLLIGPSERRTGPADLELSTYLMDLCRLLLELGRYGCYSFLLLRDP
jgi:hypothetical protein